MADSITNFFELLTKGDFFLIFLIAMMLIIIGVIVYLVKLQISDAPEYEKRRIDDEDEEDEYIEEKVLKKVQTPSYSKVEIKEEKDSDYDNRIDESPLMNFEPLKDIKELESEYEEIDNKVDNMISEGITDREDVSELLNEESTYKDEDFESPAHFKPRFVEQSKFDFENTIDPIEEEFEYQYNKEDFLNELEDNSYYKNIEENETLDRIRDYEYEQEKTAIISASELENRINELKANGEYETHERKIQEYEMEQETKAIISYEELLERAKSGVISYESEEEIGAGIRVGKVDTSNIETYNEANEKPYYKEESFLEAMKEFRRAL